MNMSAQDILTGLRSARIQVVYKSERTHVKAVFYYRDIGLAVPCIFQNIVITLNQDDVQCFQVVPPFEEHVQLFIGVAVKEIAYNY